MTAENRHHITIYTKPNCMACNQTKRLMNKKEIDYTEAPITDEVLNFARKRGLHEAPIVVVCRTGDSIDNAEAWSGFRSEHINQLAENN